MNETEQFLQGVAERYVQAETAIHEGDARPRIAMWSRAEPLTLFGAAMTGRGWAEIEPIFELLGREFSNCVSYENEVVAAEARGDLAYLVALEHSHVSIGGKAPRPYVLRVTTIFRREAGEWRIVHRHGDPLPADVGADRAALAPLAGPEPAAV
jgi:ketosteroid isomerase-like protein